LGHSQVAMWLGRLHPWSRRIVSPDTVEVGMSTPVRTIQIDGRPRYLAAIEPLRAYRTGAAGVALLFGRGLVTRGPRLVTPVHEPIPPVSRPHRGLIQPVHRRLVAPGTRSQLTRLSSRCSSTLRRHVRS
jgi:hypothetical protein